MKTAIKMVERGLVPDLLVRGGIRRLCKQRLEEETARYRADAAATLDAWLEEMRRSPVALVPEKANEQHYELPPEFFGLVLGPHRKYSGCLYPTGKETLGQAERAMLELYAERAGLVDGQDVLELGCGWGSFTLFAAETFPKSRILAVSNSAPQREFIEGEARARGLANLEVVTRDMNAFETDRRFDRVVSVEMFEHMRNWEELLGRVRGWVRSSGRVFLHVFSHRDYAYPFEVKDDSDWMSELFFTGGMMPSHGMLGRLRMPFELEADWTVDGTHYGRTSEHWLENLDANRREALRILGETYGPDEARTWFQRWRIFFLSCAELFAYDRGREWQVSHYLLRPTTEPTAS